MNITATGIKTGGITLELAALTIAVGDNGKGKTAIADAFKLGLLGYHPTLGKRPGEILKLANGKTLEVAIPGDRWGIGSIRRTWTRKGAGGSHEASEGATLFDSTVKFSPVELDFESFLQAKPTARREILEAVLPDPDPEEIANEIRLKLQGEGIDDLESSDFVALAKELAEQGREWKQESDRLKGAIQSLEIAIAEQIDPATDVTESPVELKARRDEILSEQGKHAAAIAALSDRLKKVVPQPAGGVKPTKAQIEAAKKSVEAAEQAKAANARLKIEIDKVRSKPEPEIVLDLRADIAALRDELAETEKARDLVLGKVRDLESRREKLEGCPACPTCGTAGDTFAEAIAELIDEPLELQREKLDALAKESDAKIAEIAKTEADLNDRVEEHEDEKGHAIAALEASIDLDAEITTADPNRLERLALDWDRFEASEPVSDEERAELEAKGIALAQNLADVDGKLAELKRASDLAEANSRRHGDLTSSKTAIEEAKKKVKSIKSLGDWAKSRSLEVTAERLRPFLDPANSILAGVVEGSLAINGTEIGLQQGENFRPIEVLSGAESTAVAAAIQVAIASVGEVGIVIVDELSRLTWDRRRSLIGNLLAATNSGLIKNVLVLDHDEDFVDGLEENEDVAVYRVE
jgi:hypothetical protein